MTSGSSDVPPARKPPTIFLGAEIGIGIRYFCQTGILRELIARGLEVVVLVPNPSEVRELLAEELPAIRVEKLRLDRLDLGFATGLAAWIRSLIYVSANHLRITGMSRRMNLAVPRDYRRLVERQWKLTRSRQRYLIPFLATVATLLRRNRGARKIFERVLDHRPLDKFHDELFEQYSPSLVVTSS